MAIANHASLSDSKNKKVLQQELTAVGLKPKDAVRILPDWWEEAINHPSGLFEVRGFVAKHFGLEIGPDGRLRQRLMQQACFKTRAGTSIAEIASARAVATAVARLVASVTTPLWTGSLPSAMALRTTACAHGSTPWVGLEDLLDVCWAHGVPVAYMPSLPVAKPKMDGMVTFCCGRPVILVTRKMSSPAWMLFVLAHEMGHIAEGHLDLCDGGSLVDEKVSEDDGADEQEKAANAYALTVLTGGQNPSIRLAHLVDATSLAASALAYGRDKGIDPGHVILNAVKNTKIKGKEPWPLGSAALKYIGEDTPTEMVCREALRRNIDVDALSDDSLEFFERIGLL